MKRDGAFSGWLALLAASATPADRWLLALSATAIVAGIWWPLHGVASHARVALNNQPVMRLPLHQDGEFPVQGRLGEVAVQVREGRVRLLEYASPRMIGTRTGWISRAGQVTACVPCGVMVQVEGGEQNRYDALAK